MRPTQTLGVDRKDEVLGVLRKKIQPFKWLQDNLVFHGGKDGDNIEVDYSDILKVFFLVDDASGGVYFAYLFQFFLVKGFDEVVDDLNSEPLVGQHWLVVGLVEVEGEIGGAAGLEGDLFSLEYLLDKFGGEWGFLLLLHLNIQINSPFLNLKI